jgi:hypothetical protein
MSNPVCTSPRIDFFLLKMTIICRYIFLRVLNFAICT